MSRFFLTYVRSGSALALVAGIVLLMAQAAQGQCGSQAAIDGRNLTVENACALHEVQDNYTGFTDTQPARTNGSELNALYVTNDTAKLYIGITGDVATDFENTILIFIQARTVCNQLFT